MQPVPLNKAIGPQGVRQNQCLLWKATILNIVHDLLRSMKLQPKMAFNHITRGELPSVPGITGIGQIIHLTEVERKIRFTDEAVILQADFTG